MMAEEFKVRMGLGEPTRNTWMLSHDDLWSTPSTLPSAWAAFGASISAGPGRHASGERV